MEITQKVTTNIVPPNDDMEILQQNFPQFFDKRGNFNFDKFKSNLEKKGVSLSQESYGIEWLGKSYSKILANDKTNTLLKEDVEWNTKEENVNSGNLLIKGDNLDVLKHLSNCYREQIKMIYIDPPYNTGSDGFVYQDDRKFTVKELMNLSGIDEDKAKRVLSFVNSESNSHSAWLTFMYPRLYIAQNLLKDDGVIFVSIDDNEVAQLRMLMDEIFVEQNFVALLPTIMNLKGNNDEFGFAGTHEYTLVYAKQKSRLVINSFELNEEEIEEWTEDDKGAYKQGATLKRTGTNASRTDRPNLYYPILINENDNSISTIELEEFNSIYNKNTKSFDDDYVEVLRNKYVKLGYIFLLPMTDNQLMTWRWSYDKLKDDINEIIVLKSNKLEYSLYKKQRPSLGELPSKKPKSIFYKANYSSGNGTSQIKSLFKEKIFNNPKPKNLIIDFITLGSNSSDIILDYFAGSGTTGDAVMQLNAEDGGNRKFILVQKPEIIDSEKSKTSFDFVKNELKVEEPTIFDITKERLVRAAKKIKESKPNTDEIIEEKNKLDLGFKIFETIPIWEGYDFHVETLDPGTELFRKIPTLEEDLQILLTTWKTYDNIKLTTSLEKIDLDGYPAYYHKDILYMVNKGFEINNLKKLLEEIDNNKLFSPAKIIVFGFNFESTSLREISESINHCRNKKNLEIDFIIRY